MEKIEIKAVTDSFFPAFWEIYEYSFPFCEKRSIEDQKRIFKDESYILEAWIEDEKMVGFVSWWICNDLRYVEHFAINTDVRSSGNGSAILSEWMKQSEAPVILEIEPIVDELTARRLCFYQRLGFVENDIYHWHPSYRPDIDKENVVLNILTYPEVIDDTTYQQFLKIQRAVIIPQS